MIYHSAGSRGFLRHSPDSYQLPVLCRTAHPFVTPLTLAGHPTASQATNYPVFFLLDAGLGGGGGGGGGGRLRFA